MMFGWIIILVLFYYLWSNKEDDGQWQHRNSQPKESARDLLKERFARGDINIQEFEERKRVLEQ